MQYGFPLLALILLPPQDDPFRQATQLIAQLGSDRIDVRERATERLKAMGRVALRELEKAANATDSEVALRAQSVLDHLRTPANTGDDKRGVFLQVRFISTNNEDLLSFGLEWNAPN